MDALNTPPLKWLFEHCVFEESTLELSANGVVVEIERKPLEVLRHLLRHAGEVVTKEELHSAVWPGRILSDTVLTKAVSRIREVLGDDQQAIIKTVHGYGYRLVAAVSVQAALTPQATPVLGLHAGEHPPLRPNWLLHSHLGSGGHGEVWLVEHEKTGERRVFKFALDEGALASLKREITLHRVLKSQLGEPAIVNLLDWNLQEAPFFIELEHLSAGDLADWAARQGGLQAVPLATRLELAAQIADALAQAHAVGVLHKDLKPANVLLDLSQGRPRICLADFGSGSVLEASRLDALGITRLGMTQLTGDPGDGIATPLYLAPEVLAGQPSTVQSDLYALGVMLYQIVVGDFRRPLSAGWERNIDEPLLREDIALAADGNPAHRLSDAGELARRLRSLDLRRSEREAEHVKKLEQEAAIEAATQANHKLEKLRARRTGLVAAVVVMFIGMAVSLALYREAIVARKRAETAASLALESGRFMIESLLPGFDGGEQTGARHLTVRELLDSASLAADKKLVAQPEIAFHVRTALANAYNQVEDGPREAKRQEGLAHDALRQLMTSDAPRALQLVPAEGLWIAQPSDRELVNDLLAIARKTPQLDKAALLGLLGSASDAEFRYGSLQAARKLVLEALALAAALKDLANEEDNLAFDIRLAREDADYARVAALMPDYRRKVGERQPPSPLSIAFVKAESGIAQWSEGRVQEAAMDLEASYIAIREMQPDTNWYTRYVLAYFAGLRADQGQPQQAGKLAAEWVSLLARVAPEEVDMPVEAEVVAETLWRTGDVAGAERLFRLLDAAKQPGNRQCQANFARLHLALMRLDAGDAAGARSWLVKVQPNSWQDFRVGHPRFAIEAEVQGLLARAEGHRAEAKAKLEEARKIYQAAYAPGHWRLQRIQKLLAK